MKFLVFAFVIIWYSIFSTVTAQIDVNLKLIEAIKNEKLLEVEYWLNNGANVNSKDSLGMTTLHFAAYYEDIEMLKLLTSKGADINCTSNQGFNALHYAIFCRKYLNSINHDSNPTDKNFFKALIKGKIIGGTYNIGCIQICKFLVENGININSQQFSFQPLTLAANKGDLRLCKLLVEHGAKIDFQEQAQTSAIEYASYSRVIDFLKNQNNYSEALTYYELLIQTESFVSKSDWINAKKTADQCKNHAIIEIGDSHSDYLHILNLLSKINKNLNFDSNALNNFKAYNQLYYDYKSIISLTEYLHSNPFFYNQYKNFIDLADKYLWESQNLTAIKPLLELKYSIKKAEKVIDHELLTILIKLSHINIQLHDLKTCKNQIEHALSVSDELYKTKIYAEPTYCEYLFSIGDYEKVKQTASNIINVPQNYWDPEYHYYYKMIGNRFIARYYDIKQIHDSTRKYLAYSSQFASIYKGENHLEYQLGSLIDLSVIEIRTRNFNKAKKYLERFQELIENDPLKYAHLHNNCLYFLSLLHFYQEDYTNAMYYHNKSRIITNEQNNYDLYSLTLGVILYSKLNMQSELVESIRHFFELMWRRNNNSIFSLSEEQRKLYWYQFENKFDIISSIILKQTDDKTIKSLSKTLYDNILSSKGILLNTSRLIQSKINESGNAELINTYKKFLSYKQHIDFLENRATTKEEYLNRFRTIADSIEDILINESQEYFKEYQNQKVNMHDIKKYLNEDESAIEFFAVKKYNDYNFSDSTFYYALILKKNNDYPELIQLFEERQLDSLYLIPNANNYLYNSRATNLVSTKRQLFFDKGFNIYNLIWKPIEKSLIGINKIYYTPSGKLNQISFAAIPVDSTMLLCDKYELHQLTSTREISLERYNRNSTIESASLFGAIKYEMDTTVNDSLAMQTDIHSFRSSFSNDSTLRSSYFSYLPGSEQEVKQIDQELQVNQIQTHLFTGIQANESNFKSLGNKSPDILHIATHGFYMPVKKIKNDNFRFIGIENIDQRTILEQNPLLRTGLVLAGANHAWRGDSIPSGWEDGILTGQEIAHVNLTNTKLVVLSACETGLGDDGGSEGVFGLQRAFKMAGVQSIIMSLWQVPDKETSEMMQNFYKYWLGGLSKNEAFRKAQFDIRKIKPDPYYWAGFVFVD